MASDRDPITGVRRRWWQLRVWHGMTITAWVRLLARNRFKITPRRFYLVAIISATSLLNSLLAAVQTLLFSRRIRRAELREDPIIILGHWRSGTTLLHELLSLDSRHYAPSTYACLAPDHFLVSQWALSWWLRFLLPKRRSQDNVEIGFDKPQEDEWAICSMGLPSPYRAAAFPRHAPHAGEHFDLLDTTPSETRKWMQKWKRFLQAVSLREPGKRLVLKSPLHTARIAVLLEMFPKAHFVYVERNRHDVLRSTLRLWSRLAEDEGLQTVESDRLKSMVLDNYRRLHRSFAASADLIRSEQLTIVRYEQLIEDPLTVVCDIYAQHHLGELDQSSPRLAAHAEQAATFQTSRYPRSEETDAWITDAWNKEEPSIMGVHLDAAGRRAA